MAMKKQIPFEPDWVVPTAEMLREWMDDNGLTSTRIACAGTIPRHRRDAAAAVLDAVLNDEPVTDEVAALLASVTGVSAAFWTAFERNYRSGLAAGRKVWR